MASAFCGKEKTWVDASWRHFSQLMTQNNIAITSRVKHQRLHFYLIVSNKQKKKNYSCPSSCSYPLQRCGLHSVFLCMNVVVRQYGSRCCEHQTTEIVRGCHYMRTRSPFKLAHLHWLFRVIIDFLTTAMTSLISPLVCHLTQMGSLAAGPDNNSSWYESAIAWIKHLVLFTANVHHAHYKEGPWNAFIQPRSN